MRHTVLSYTFVGVWTTPLPAIPPMKPPWLLNLFEEPYTTAISGLPDGGLMVQKLGKPPVPAVMFGPSRFQVVHTSAREVARIMGVFMTEANNLTNQRIPYLASVGLNTEHEWTRPTFNPAPRWLAKQFIARGLTSFPDSATVEAASLQFSLVLSKRRYNIQLQPRNEKLDGVFAAINDHRDWNDQVPPLDTVEKLLDESVAEIRENVTPLIFGGIADA